MKITGLSQFALLRRVARVVQRMEDDRTGTAFLAAAREDTPIIGRLFDRPMTLEELEPTPERVCEHSVLMGVLYVLLGLRAIEVQENAAEASSARSSTS